MDHIIKKQGGHCMLTCQKCGSHDYHIKDASHWAMAMCNNCNYYITWLPMQKEIICHNCGSADDYHTVISGPHLKAICNGCDKYIKFLPERAEPLNRLVQAVNKAEHDLNKGDLQIIENAIQIESEYGIDMVKYALHQSAPPQSHNQSLTSNKINMQNNQNGWAAPQQQQPQEQQNGKVLPEGIRLFDKHPNAPDFVLASLVISLNELFAFAQKNPQLLADYQGQKQLKLQILRSQQGKIYSVVDTYGTPAQAAPAPAPQQQPAYWGAAPVQQPAPQQPGAIPSMGDLPF